MGSALRPPEMPPSARVVLGVKVKVSQALAAVVQVKVTCCAPTVALLKLPADETLRLLASTAVEAYQLPSCWTAMRRRQLRHSRNASPAGRAITRCWRRRTAIRAASPDRRPKARALPQRRSEEHTSELQSL